MRLNEFDCLRCERIRNCFVMPTSRFPATHITNSANAIHDRVVVPMRRLQGQQVRPLLAGRFVADLFLIVHLDRIGGIEPDNPMVFNVDAWRAVACGGEDEEEKKTQIFGGGAYIILSPPSPPAPGPKP